MADESSDEQSFPSTTWAWRRVNIRPPARADKTGRRSRGRWWGVAPVERAHKLRIEVTYRGGSQCWYLVESRGRHGAFAGDRALHDIIREICQQG